jgi:Putative Flp pilus-assembly TadE/G-like
MSIRYNDARREEGAVLVQTAVMILVLVALSTYIIDYGIVWLTRGQAQNAADAGALAGAIAMAYDDFDDPPASGGPAETAAHQVAQGNIVWDTAPGTVVTWNCPPGVTGRCIRVDAHRDGTNGSATLPTFFGPLLGIASQSVRATATARVQAANASNCMRPFAVADKWTEIVSAGRFDRWVKKGADVLELDPHDIYVAPTEDSPGTGYTLALDLGTEFTLKHGNPQAVSEDIVSGWFLAVNLPDGEGGFTSGGDDFRENIGTCIGNPVAIGQYLPVEEGNMIGPAAQGFDDLRVQDEFATWNDTDDVVENSCAPGCAPISPRIIPLPVFDMDEFQFHREGGVNPGESGAWSHCAGGGKCIKVVNILGFFADRMSGSDIIGYLVTIPGEFVLGAPAVNGAAAFVISIQLIR